MTQVINQLDKAIEYASENGKIDKARVNAILAKIRMLVHPTVYTYWKREYDRRLRIYGEINALEYLERQIC